MKSVLAGIGAFVATVLFYLFWWESAFLPQLDYKIYDRLTASFPSRHSSGSTVIVEIDDKSLKAFGQWPWPRIMSAEIINRISDAKPAVIAFDVIFSEYDRLSPDRFQLFYKKFFDLNVTTEGIPEAFRDNDRILSESIGRNKTILPVFYGANSEMNECLLPNAVSYTSELRMDQIYDMGGMACSLPIYQRQTKGIGHIHAMGDSDGTLRRIPLLVRYKEVLLPTLGLSAVGLLGSSIDAHPVSKLEGDIGIDLYDRHLRGDSSANGLLTFYPFEKYEKISAYDLLSGNYDPAAMRGKFVFVGTTTLGLDTQHTLSNGSQIPGVYLHATMVENILNNDLKVQPSIYPLIHIVFSFMVALILLLLMRVKRYLSILAVVFAVVAIAIFGTYWGWQHNRYISIGYLVVPLLSYLFILSLILFFIDYRDKKNFIAEIERTREKKARLKNELERSEAEIEYQKTILFQQSKLAAMGEMIDNIAHQWRQPLNMLGVIIQDLEHTYRSGKMDKHAISEITADSMEQIMFMSNTIEDFRNFMKPNQKNIPFDINEAVEQSIQLLWGMFESYRIHIDVLYSKEPVSVFGAPSEFKQVVINLLQNARDALLEHLPLNPTITIRIVADNSYVSLTIQDNGGGIRSEVMERVFEPYFTTKQEGQGSGIGLYMSYTIIHTKMGGMLVGSNTDDGALFSITLPLWKGLEE